MKDPSNRTLTFTWTNIGTSGAPAWRITQVAGPTGTYSVTYAYNTDKNLQSVTLDPTGLNRTTSFGYTSVDGETGLLASITDPLGNQVSYGYGTYTGWRTGAQYVSSVTEPAGVTTTGTPRTQVWTIGLNAVFGYTDVTSNQSLEMSVRVDPSLRALMLMASKRKGDMSSTFLMRYYYEYDTANNVIQSDDAMGGYGASSGTYDLRYYSEYGPHGNVLETCQKDSSGNKLRRTIYGYYDASKYFQKASVTDPMGRTSTFDYYGTTDGDTTQANRGEVRWVRDPGYAVAGSTSYGKQFTYGYNTYGQKEWEKDLKGTVTKYTCGDSWGNLTQVVRDPNVANPPYTGLNRTTSMVYDVAGRVTSSTDALGQNSTFQYNKLGQPTYANFPARGASPAETISYNYAANGRTNSVTDGRGTTTLAYETGCDRVSSVTDPATGTVSYEYLASGERSKVTYPGNRTLTYQYRPYTPTNDVVGLQLTKDDPNSIGRVLDTITDENGRVVKINPVLNVTNSPGVPFDGRLYSYRFNQTFDQSGNLTRYCDALYDYDFSNPNTVNNGRLMKLQVVLNQQVNGQWQQTTLAQNTYTYNDNGQRTQNAITGQAPGTRTEVYGYDELSRLTTVNYGDGQSQTYGFDAMGNRASKQNVQGGTTTSESYLCNNLNELGSRTINGSGQTYTNDLVGNTLTGGGRTNTWDSQNRLVNCAFGGKTSAMTYGSDGLRRRMTTTNADGSQVRTDYVLDGQNVVAETVQNRATSGGTWSNPQTASYLMGPSGPLYRKPGATSTDVRWYLYDGLGSVVGEVNVSGLVTSAKKHDVYGATRASTGTPTSKHGFVGNLGHTSDDETGLVYMRARHYDPTLGRFTSEDSAKDGANWFVYCANNPINLVDVTGKAPILLASAAVATLLTIALAVAVLTFVYSFLKSWHDQYRAGEKNIDWGKAVSEGAFAAGGVLLAELLVGVLTPVAGAGLAAATIGAAIFAVAMVVLFAYVMLVDHTDFDFSPGYVKEEL